MAKRRYGALTMLSAAAGLTVLLVPTAGGALPGGPGPADQADPHATLVRTHVFLPGPAAPARGGGGGGKPVPPTTNCTADDGSDNGASTPTGFISNIDDRVAHLNLATVPAGLNGNDVVQTMRNAFGEWSANGAPSFDVVTDSVNVTRETANLHTDLLFGRTPGNAIAVTYTWRWTFSDGSPQQYESDTVFSNRLPWYIYDDASTCYASPVAYDLENIAAHEFGHIYGLDHDSGRFATMYGYGYTGETLKRSLQTHEAAYVNTLY